MGEGGLPFWDVPPSETRKVCIFALQIVQFADYLRQNSDKYPQHFICKTWGRDDYIVYPTPVKYWGGDILYIPQLSGQLSFHITPHRKGFNLSSIGTGIYGEKSSFKCCIAIGGAVWICNQWLKTIYSMVIFGCPISEQAFGSGLWYFKGILNKISSCAPLKNVGIS